MNTKILRTIDWHNVPQHEIDAFLSSTKELQYKAAIMKENCLDPFEKELYDKIMLLAIKAEENALKREMQKAWQNIKQIIHKGIILDNEVDFN